MIDIGNGVKMVTRAEWGARAPRGVTPFTPDQGSTAHWEGPHMGSFPHSSCAAKVRGIQNFHMDAQGWTDIAYTALICPHGYAFQGRWLNVRTAANGTSAGNNGWYAICYLGGQGDAFPDAAKRAMGTMFDYLDRNGAGGKENCHRDHKPTECPGNVICAWVRSGTPIPGGVTPPPVDPEDDDMPRPVLARDSQDKLWLIDGQTRRLVHPDDVSLVRKFFNPQQKSDGYAHDDLPDSWIWNHVDIGVLATSSLVLAETAEDVDKLVGE